MKEKRGEGTPVWLLIAIVLGVIVLVVIALGFVGGFEGIIDRLNIFGGSTLANAAEACGVSCSTGTAGSTAGWCVDIKTIKSLEPGQLDILCAKIGAGDQCTAKKGVASGVNSQSVDFGKKRAKVTCASLAPELINPCEINCQPSSTGQRCTGTPTACASIDVSSTKTDVAQKTAEQTSKCAVQAGCAWNTQNSKCEGTPTPCANRAATSACNLGCTLQNI